MIFERRASTALPARYSCTNPRIVLPRTTARTMAASVHSPTAMETIAAKIRIRTRGLLNWPSRSTGTVTLICFWIALGP